jgi:hypothetical protein
MYRLTPVLLLLLLLRAQAAVMLVDLQLLDIGSKLLGQHGPHLIWQQSMQHSLRGNAAAGGVLASLAQVGVYLKVVLAWPGARHRLVWHVLLDGGLPAANILFIVCKSSISSKLYVCMFVFMQQASGTEIIRNEQWLVQAGAQRILSYRLHAYLLPGFYGLIFLTCNVCTTRNFLDV